MVVLQKMQNSIFSTLSLMRLFSGKRSLCAKYAGSFFVSSEERTQYDFYNKVAVHYIQISVSLRFDSKQKSKRRNINE